MVDSPGGGCQEEPVGTGSAKAFLCMPSPSQRWGYAQEALAESLLTRHGYVVVERNWRGGGAEIDRIAWQDGLLCFVEVRARRRTDCGRPEATVDRRKQRHIVRGAMAYLLRFPPREQPMVRFDVVSVVEHEAGPPEVTLIENAFDAGA